jgi:cellulose biosynthesis protein BcsE
MPVTKSPHSKHGLRIGNLTPVLGLEQGKLYAIAAEDDGPAASLLWHTLLYASETGGPVSLVSAPGLAANLAQSGLQKQVQHAIAGKVLSVFEMDPPPRTAHPPSAADQRARARRLAQDLAHQARLIGQTPRLLIINGAEALFPALDDSTLRFWRAHAEQAECALVLLFRERVRALATLWPLAQAFAGLVELKSRYGATSLGIFHWFHPERLQVNRSVPLRPNAQGVLAAHEATPDTQGAELAPGMAAIAPAADETRCIAMRSVFAPQEKAPTGWRITDDDLGLLQSLGEGAVAATFVLAFTPDTDFDQLARCLYTLRKRGGHRVKILVREVGSRLRYNQETLAVRLGANLVVPAELSTPRFLSLGTMVQGQVFPHGLPSSYEQALKEAMPEQERGYLPPAEFTRAVRTALAHSRVLGVQVALLRLPLAYGLLPLDALRYCKVKRAGDLCTADAASVYVFLYACRENDVDTTLERLFTLPIGELFTSDDRLLAPRAIEDVLRDIDQRHASDRFPDLSGELARLLAAPSPTAPLSPPRPGPQALASASTTTSAAQAGNFPPLAPTHYPAPPPAVPAPLALRASIPTPSPAAPAHP